MGNREIAVTRELTKQFEEIVRGTVDIVIEEFRQRSSIKGELTLVIAGAKKNQPVSVDTDTIVSELKKCIIEQGLSRKDAVKSVAAELGLPKNNVYKESLKLNIEY